MRYLGGAPGHQLASQGMSMGNFQPCARNPLRAMHDPTAQECEAVEAMMGKTTEDEVFEEEQASYEYDDVPDKDDEDDDGVQGDDERAYARAGLPVP